MEDKTNYGQSLMHMIKGNLGTGILAMPASFAHAGLITASIGMPFLCVICTYCVHLLVDSSRHLEGKTKSTSFEYANLAKYSFQLGPIWLRNWSQPMCRLVDGTLLVAQIGVCCVYLVFVTDNIVSILATRSIYVSKNSVFLAIFPIALLLSYIRTLNRLAIASAIANLLQSIGIAIILQYLAYDLEKVDLNERENFQSIDNIALGFGSAMFAFEGISVVLPVYSRMKNSQRMSGCMGVINVSYTVLLILNFIMGLFGFLKFGHEARDSITLNLPPEPLYDIVRAIFLVSVFLTYPLQFYVPNEIIWKWVRKNLLIEPETMVQSAIFGNESSSLSVLPAISVRPVNDGKQGQNISSSSSSSSCNLHQKAHTTKQQVDISALPAPPISELNGGKEFQSVNGQSMAKYHASCQLAVMEHKTADLITKKRSLIKYEYLCRSALVVLTFVLAISVPKLNLLMDLIGSITGTALSLVLPAIIHIATFWNDDSTGFNKFINVLLDLSIIVFGFVAGTCGTVSSLISIMNSFQI